MRRKHFYIFILLCSFGLPMLAQTQQGRVEALRVAFFTRKIELTTAEAQVFWPVYNAYQAELKAEKQKSRMERFIARQNINDISDSELEKVVDNYLLSKERELAISRKYHTRFKQILPIRKVAKLYVAEKQFTMLLIKGAQENRGTGRAGGRGGRGGGRF